MPRDLICCACLTIIAVDSHDWAETMTLHILDSAHTHPRLLAVMDIDAAFDGITRHYHGQCAR